MIVIETIGVKIGSVTEGLERGLAKSDALIKKMELSTASLGRGLQRFGDRASAIGQQMLFRFTLPLGIKLGMMQHQFSSFNMGMTESLAIFTGITDDITTQMERVALGLSKESKFDPTQLAQGYFFLGSAGLNAAKSMSALPVVTRFAQAGVMDLAAATERLMDSQVALGLKSDDLVENERNMTRVSDVLVKANTLANASVAQFADALTSKAAGAIRSVNMELEEGVAILAAYADRGFKGEMAGEQLAIMLANLQNAAVKNREEFRKYQIEVFDDTGRLRKFADILGDMETKFSTMSAETRVATLAELGFAERAIKTINVMMGASADIRRLNAELVTAAGTTSEVAARQMEAFGNRMRVMWNNVRVTAINAFATVAPYILRGADLVIKLANAIDKMDPAMKRIVITVMAVVAALGPALIGFGLFVKMIGFAVVGISASLPIFLLLASVVAGLGFAFVQATGQGDTFGKRASSSLMNFANTVQVIEVTVLGFWIRFKTAVQIGYDVLQWIVTSSVESIVFLVSDIAKIGKWLFDIWRNVWHNMLEYTTTAIVNMGSSVKRFGGSLVDWLKNPFKGFEMRPAAEKAQAELNRIQWKQIGYDVLQWIVTSSVESIVFLVSDIAKIGKWLFDIWRNVWHNMLEYTTTAIVNMGSSVKRFGGSLVDWLKNPFKGFEMRPAAEKAQAELNRIQWKPQFQLASASNLIASLFGTPMAGLGVQMAKNFGGLLDKSDERRAKMNEELAGLLDRRQIELKAPESAAVVAPPTVTGLKPPAPAPAPVPEPEVVSPRWAEAIERGTVAAYRAERGMTDKQTEFAKRTADATETSNGLLSNIADAVGTPDEVYSMI